jgi:hypothetical protein
MDDIVKQAMAKWPHVPHCYSWLGLDARGNWYMRDDRTQAIGGFASGLAGAKGSMLKHEKLIDFIERNYAADAQGCWYFQNGPQRVYVELEATPFIWRVDDKGAITSSARQTASLVQLLMDERGWPYLQTSLGFGLVHTQDVASLAQALEHKHWPIEEVSAAQLPARFGYQMSPAALEIKK